MRYMKWILILSFFCAVGVAHEVLVNTEDGKTFVFDFDPAETVGRLQERISSLTKEDGFIMALPSQTKKNLSRGGYLKYPREYGVEVTESEKSDIRYIVTSLADRSLITLAFIKSDLEAAGDRILHIHPLRFLMAVFTDEEMKVGIRNIRARGWIWGDFSGGLKNTLIAEMSVGNILQYIEHFAQSVEIDIDLIYPHVISQNWDKFIDVLIKEIPRKGDHDRYDMLK